MLVHSILDDLMGEATTTMVTPGEVAGITGFDLFEVQRFFHGWAEHRAYNGEMLMPAVLAAETFEDRGITSTEALKAENDRQDRIRACEAA